MGKDIIDNDVMPYKKKAKKKIPHKSKHKHEYQKCTVIIETVESIAEYCPICGKIKTVHFWSKPEEVKDITPKFIVFDPFVKNIDIDIK